MTLTTKQKQHIGVASVSWLIFGIVAYKYWNTSNITKGVILVTGAYNVYNTYKLCQELKSGVKPEGESAPATENEVELTNETV